MFTKNILLLSVLILALLSGVPAAAAIEELDVAIIGGTAIPFAKEDHLAYGIVKVWNKASEPVEVTLSITPNRDHRLDDNRYWGNYKEIEDIKVGANELRVQIFCFTVPANSNTGKQTWTLNVSTGGQVITKEVVINLPVTKNVQVNAPTWQPDILKLDLPPAKPDTITVEASKPKVILLMLKVAGNLNSKKVYDIELDAPLPDIFFSYPEEITVAMSKPESWDFENQEFLPFTVVPVPLLTVNVPYSSNGNMYELELQLEEERTGLKASLPFQLVITPTEKTVEAEVVENTAAVNVNETVNDSETAIVTETAVAVNSSEIVTLATPTPIEEAESETGKSGNIWQSFINWLWHSTAGLATFIIFCCILLILVYRIL